MRISDAFAAGRRVFSFEFFPPKTEEGVRSLFETVSELAPLDPTFVSVTYGAGGTTRELTIDLATRIKQELRLETMAHLTCVGHGAAEIESILEVLEARGIENVLPLRGDPPRGETQFVKPVDGFAYAQELVRFIRARYGFCLGGACYPEGHLECPNGEEDLDHLREKVDAGVEFLITQLFFDPDHYFDFVERARNRGITLPIVPGVMPVTNVGQIERFTSMCGASIPAPLQARLDVIRNDDEAVVNTGIDWATEQCRRLLEGGAPGIHFYTLNRSRSSRTVYLNLNGARQ
ncbi:MAG: methylenetetrahydrofolate reductase [NAD(P)H] [Candidatus Handelsmanbacteria bacterium RIFCSPLOWO2_12_FULL_64_10]|uniref:Methylenetetrahydrofolate reductase n=1 Tax=Handelsmanbacteria sp. (strain RIFCSPLOWO2_12_FULL_64_10) TaxID=1817868 RepID=A0A1F6CG59_HANXR|nr:MAG: methylenetetrahydrofolate reductase [NAD(P)H] [Candidatus Handelsmanbacteria bacterium RIFCSPLOWO2_12_FULL_64_10]